MDITSSDGMGILNYRRDCFEAWSTLEGGKLERVGGGRVLEMGKKE